MRYSTSNNGMPLKSGLTVIENNTFGYSSTTSYCKCSSSSTVFEIFDVDNIVIVISGLKLLTLPIYARPAHRWHLQTQQHDDGYAYLMRRQSRSWGHINPLTGTLKPQSNGSLYSNTVIGTLAVDGWAVTFGTARRGLGGLGPRPVPSSLYQM